MLSDVWPLFCLVVATPRLELRLARENEIAEIAELAGRGVHPPGERPFLTPPAAGLWGWSPSELAPSEWSAR